MERSSEAVVSGNAHVAAAAAGAEAQRMQSLQIAQKVPGWLAVCRFGTSTPGARRTSSRQRDHVRSREQASCDSNGQHLK